MLLTPFENDALLAAPDAHAAPDLLAAARRLQPAVLAAADETEAHRGPPDALMRQLTGAGLFRMLAPRSVGGVETDPMTALGVVEAIAAADGSTGWLVLANVGGMCTAFLDADAAHRIFHAPDLVIGGALVPSGRAVPVAGGYRVIGRWAFGSGVNHSTWMMLGCIVVNADGSMPAGPPQLRPMYVPRSAIEVLDTWHVTGMRGTGSHDVVVTDAFVPAEHTFSLLDQPVESGPLYRFPLRGLGAGGIAAVTLGIARGAIDTFMELASTRTPTFSQGLLAERSSVQTQVARAEATVRAARAFLFDTLSEVWDATIAGRPDGRHPALLRLAATHAVAGAVEAVDLMNTAAGGAAIVTGSRLERAFRDVHTAKQHFSVQPTTYEQTGRALLGLPPLPGPPL